MGNYIESPNNGIRDESFDIENEEWKPVWFDDIEQVRKELEGSLITHYDFIRLMKEKGIHRKYYRHRRYENNCEACKALGLAC